MPPSDRVYYWVDTWADSNADGTGDVHCSQYGPYGPNDLQAEVERQLDPISGAYPCDLIAIHGENLAGEGPIVVTTPPGGA